MMSYIISTINQSDKRARNQHSALLSKAGLPADQPADVALGIYDHNYELIAAGSLSDNELHSIIVDTPYRGKGLMGQLVSHLYELRFQSGHHDLCVTVPDELTMIFKSLGFYEINRNSEDIVYMGNHHAVRICQ